MKPDKFDEAIRRKLEGIQPSFQEEDWKKFKAYQSTHVPTPFLQRYGRSLLYSAASVAAAVMVFANVYQYRQKQQLDQEITQLKSKLSQQDNAPIRISTRIDTVYITKYIPIESPSQPNAYAPSVPSSDEPGFEQLKPENPKQVAESLKNVGKIIRQNPNERISEAFERQPVENETTVSEETDNNAATEAATGKSTAGSSSGNVKNNSSSLKKERIVKNTQPTSSAPTSPSKTNEIVGRSESSSRVVTTHGTDESETAAGSVVNEAVSVAPPEIAMLEPKQSLDELEGLTPAEVRVQRYAYATLAASNAANTSSPNSSTKSTPPPPPSISLRNVKFRMGAGFNIGDKYTGFTANTGLLLGKYWSLDVGLGTTKINGPQYYTEEIFKAKNNRDFQTWKKSGPPQPPLLPPQALEIKTSVSLVRMPVSLTYRWPIKEGLSVLVSGGTNLNLSAKQEYSYMYRERNGEYEQEEGRFEVQPSLSNDFMFSAGIEKQWKSLVFQSEVYAAPYLQKPAYLTENRNIGVRFKVLYEFGKKRI
ncbi:MAG: hypothetical protein U0X91_12970 [Spirosomataceae bacterium]